ncbi:lysM domain protein [Chlamydia pneumoniae LPCoLN]|uniref:LysM peptidoglycan-binding domain-containing protein n=1 Tax=Chlamydia pneumoniae TaxID=83558 RepID=UPI0001BD9E00|nr:LysM peptidoglycan-binding domain-containing protein [Chlamydia pneumoniae]ACZ33569.1 lysM domain protein [Chlamydia pneumoniae LPCoLN]
MAFKRKTRWLWQVLILSLGLNMLFLLLFYSAIFRKDIYKLHLFSGPLIAKSSRKVYLSEDFLNEISQASLDDLISLFKDERYMYGRPIKLWALSVAIASHHIDITPVLSKPLTYTELKGSSVRWLLPNIDLKDFPVILDYLRCHKYPYTSKGLFLLIEKMVQEGWVDEDCLYHFCSTPEFLYLRTLLVGADVQASSVASLARMVIRCGSERFFHFCNEESRTSMISATQRQKVLKSYLDCEESLAALLLLVHDSDVVLHEFCDEDLEKVIRLMPQESPYSQNFFSRLQHSPRRELACMSTQRVEAPRVQEDQDEEYVVQDGDSLWLIAKRFGIPMDKIIQKNGLNHHRLFPGKVLKLPAKQS